MSGQDSTPRAVVYHRVARDTPDTPGGQLEAVERYAKAHGYEILPPFWRKADAPEASLVITDAEPVTEYGVEMSGGGYQIRWADPSIEDIYPAQDWITNQIRNGRHVSRRRIIVVEDWTDITGEES